MRFRYLIALSAIGLAACAKEPTGARREAATTQTEAALATSFASFADSTAQRNGAPMPRLLEAFFRELQAHPNAQAQALVDQSRALADSGRVARDAGDMDAARRYFIAAHETLFDAVVIVLPNAYERTGAVVDTILARITERLGDRDAPRIRRVLGVIAQVRSDAQAAAATDEGHALALNLRALAMLQRLRDHLQHPGGQGLPGDQGQGPPPGGRP
jgi:hypothetical protein